MVPEYPCSSMEEPPPPKWEVASSSLAMDTNKGEFVNVSHKEFEAANVGEVCRHLLPVWETHVSRY